MGVVRETDTQEIDLVKEMAEALGSQGLRLEEILERIKIVRSRVDSLVWSLEEARDEMRKPSFEVVNQSIRQHNMLVDKAHDALRWLLIQREACGFRRHRDVDLYYPIPPKLRPLEP